jgi:hypothetical protein
VETLMRGMCEINLNLDLISIEELELEISERRTLINQMVGRLYPAVLTDEIEDIRAMIREKRLA